MGFHIIRAQRVVVCLKLILSFEGEELHLMEITPDANSTWEIQHVYTQCAFLIVVVYP